MMMTPADALQALTALAHAELIQTDAQAGSYTRLAELHAEMEITSQLVLRTCNG
jgi:hypothetical protein